MDDKARIAELEGMVAGLRDYVRRAEWIRTVGLVDGRSSHEALVRMEEPLEAALIDTQAVAEAHDARIERRGRAKELKELAKDLYSAGQINTKPTFAQFARACESKAEELEKEVG